MFVRMTSAKAKIQTGYICILVSHVTACAKIWVIEGNESAEKVADLIWPVVSQK
jgi:hypothetical protein